MKMLVSGRVHIYTQEVQIDQTNCLPLGRIGNPCSVDHPKNHSLFGLGLPGFTWVFPKKKRYPQIMNFNRLFGFSIINHPFWGTPMFGSTHILVSLKFQRIQRWELPDDMGPGWIWANYNDVSRRVVTLNGGLIRELPQNPLNSGLGIILICPDGCVSFNFSGLFLVMSK